MDGPAQGLSLDNRIIRPVASGRCPVNSNQRAASGPRSACQRFAPVILVGFDDSSELDAKRPFDRGLEECLPNSEYSQRRRLSLTSNHSMSFCSVSFRSTSTVNA
jgi:hypothetical protein